MLKRYVSVHTKLCTLDSGIDVGQEISVEPGKFGKKNKRRSLNQYIHILYFFIIRNLITN